VTQPATINGPPNLARQPSTSDLFLLLLLVLLLSFLISLAGEKEHEHE
jgi:hypothetical protein